jgi:cell division protease FtsH
MVTRYAMVPSLGNVAFEAEAGGFLGGRPGGLLERTYSEETAREIDCAVRDIVEDAFREARGVLERNRGLLEEGSRLLMEKETLSESDLENLFGKGIVPPGPVAERTSAGTAGAA